MTTIQDLDRQINRIKSEMGQMKSDVGLLSIRVNSKNIAGDSLAISFGVLDVLSTVGATVNIANLISRSGEPENFISLGIREQLFSVGEVEMLTLTESDTQDVIKIGPDSGDVDIIFNGGEAFLRGSDGFLGVGNVAPVTRLDVTGTVQITDRIQHANDINTWIGFTTDDIEMSAGNLSMLKLTEAAQNVVRLGPGSGDVDINFNQYGFWRGSDGFLGVGNVAPVTMLDVTGTVQITDSIQHANDINTKLSFTNDDIELVAGNVSMLKLTEATQDVVRLGPGSGDVDINFNGDGFWRGSDGFFGIGNSSPSHPLDVTGNIASEKDQNGVTYIRCINNTDGTNAAASVTVATHITSDDQGFSLQAFSDSYTPTGPGGMSLAGWGRLRTDGNVKGFVLNAAKSDANIIFATGGNQAIRIHDVFQAVMIGGSTASPGAKLHVDQASLSAAMPVLLLDQADVDRPFEKYVGTAAAATLDRSIVDDGDVTTATLVGWRKIEVEDIGNQVVDGQYYEPFYSLA